MKNQNWVILTVMATSMLVGCASTPTPLDEFRANLQQAVMQYTGTDDIDVIMSAVRSVNTHQLQIANIEKQATIAALALERDPSQLRAASSELATLIADQPLHTTGKSVQALAAVSTLFAPVDEGQIRFASRQVLSHVEQYCGGPETGLATINEQTVSDDRPKYAFENNLRLACHYHLRGAPDRRSLYMARTYTALSQSPNLESVLTGAEVVGGADEDAARVFIHRMELAGYSFRVPVNISQ